MKINNLKLEGNMLTEHHRIILFLNVSLLKDVQVAREECKNFRSEINTHTRG